LLDSRSLNFIASSSWSWLDLGEPRGCGCDCSFEAAPIDLRFWTDRGDGEGFAELAVEGAPSAPAGSWP
jgi:hypothetical protein